MLVPSSYARVLALKEASHSLAKPGVLVDAGCGDGFHLLQIEAARKIGLDLIPPKLQDDIEVVKCNLTFIPLKSGCCDCLMSLDVIEHIKEEDKVISEFQRVLGHNGILILTTPNNSEFMPYGTLRVMFGLDTAKIHRMCEHVRPGYSKDELSSLVERHGFKVIYHHSFCQPMVRVLELVYLLPMRLSEYIYSPQERELRLRTGKLINGLQRVHDLLFLLLVAPIIKQVEKRANNGFLHLLICKKLN